MRVLLFHFTELGSLGGVDVAVVTLAEALLARGFSPAIAEITPEGKPPRTLPSGIPVWSVASSSYPSPSRPRSWASFVRSTLQFRKVLNDFRPGIVHVHFPVAQCLPAVALASFPHKWKLIATVHNSDIRVSPIQAPAIIPWQRRLFDRADSLTAVSQSLLDDADTAYPNFRAKARVIRNGVGPRWFQLHLEPDPNANYVLFVGRLHPVKGVDVLLHAWKSASALFPKTELWIAGDGPHRQEYETLVKDLNLSSSIRFLGRKSEEDLPLLYRNSRVLVLPSRREGLPITLLEAGACGAICIGTQTPGIPEIINENQTGFVVPTDSPEHLSQAIIKSLQMSPAQSLAFRQAARKRIVDEFSESGMIDQYVSLYQSVLR
ncbi:MAG: glycosyltransferase family 4 protein [Candidatus Acidiferrum sp.]